MQLTAVHRIFGISSNITISNIGNLLVVRIDAVWRYIGLIAYGQTTTINGCTASCYAVQTSQCFS